MKKKTSKILLCVFLMLVGFIPYAQNNGKGKGNPPNPSGLGAANTPPPPGLPIDGGLSFLMMVGAVYGIYELKRKK